MVRCWLSKSNLPRFEIKSSSKNWERYETSINFNTPSFNKFSFDDDFDDLTDYGICEVSI